MASTSLIKARPEASRNWSLASRLSWLLGAATISVWLISAVAIYWQADHESNELFDDSIAEMAHSLLAMAQHQAEDLVGTSHTMEDDAVESHSRFLFYQLWGPDGKLIYRSRGSPNTRFASAQHDGFDWKQIDGSRWRIYAAWNDRHDLQVEVGERYTHRREISDHFAWLLGLIALISLPSLIYIVWKITERTLRPIKDSAEAIANRSENDLGAVRADAMPAEVRPLFEALNRLFIKIERAMDQQRRFTADAAHEIRTPLAGIRANAQLLKRAALAPFAAEAAADLIAGVDRCTRLVGQLLQLASIEPLAHQNHPIEAVSVDNIIRQIIGEHAAPIKAKRLDVSLALSPLQLDSRLGLFEILLRNLIDNAIRYSKPGGRIQISCLRAQNGAAQVDIVDDGPGIPAALRARAFDRFFRVPGTAEPGSGLGLSLARRIADLHQADIKLDEGPAGQGLSVNLLWPKARNADTAVVLVD